jgi:outer membrane receptor protein involved in Fe transport
MEYKAPLGGYYYAFGNPNLEPEETTEYEVGLTRQLGQKASIDLTAYYKDVKNLVDATTITSRPAAFSSYRNRDYGTIKGVDLSFNLRRTERIQASINYSLSFANGTGSTSETQRNIAWQFQPGVAEPPKQTFALDFDQRHKLAVNIDYRLGNKDGPRLGDSYPLSNAGANLLLSYGSGLPYTPTEIFNEVTEANVASTPTGPINSVYGPSTYQLDMKVNKDFKVGSTTLTLYAWGMNLLNRDNVSSRDTDGRGIENAVYSATGSAETTRWLSTPDGQKFLDRWRDMGRQLYDLKERDPRNFGSPRQVRFGVTYGF